MTPAELRRLHTLTADVIGVDPDDLESDTDFAEDLNVEFGELADLFGAIEEAFGVVLADTAMQAVHTVRDLEELLDDEIG